MSRLLGGLFAIATFPGIVVSGAFQRYCDGRFLPPLEELLDESAFEDAVLEERDDSDAGRESADETFGDDQWIDETTPGGDGWTVDGENDVSPAVTDSIPYEGLLAITVVPFVLSTALAVVVFLVSEGVLPSGTAETVLWWLGLSIAVHAFPNASATALLWDGSKTASTPLRFVGMPLAGLSRLALLGRVLWLDLLYGLLLLVAVRELLALV